jgi:NAD(P)-dependent dehydrogenase (short-subunit alcohol dehydrogenase family)
MLRTLAGRVAIVTGGGRGLGRSISLGLALAGARVIATAARECAEIEQVAREADGAIVPLLADVANEADAPRRSMRRSGGSARSISWSTMPAAG